jgi:hypothetical protein
MVHKDLFRYLIPGGIISILCGIFGWLGISSPNSLGWPTSSPLIVKGILVILGCMPLLWLFAYRLQLRSFWVYRHTPPVTMYLKIEIQKDSDSTSYYALLRSSPDSPLIQKIPVYPPSWKTESHIENRPARVFIDPRSAKPLVIEMGENRLWTMAG